MNRPAASWSRLMPTLALLITTGAGGCAAEALSDLDEARAHHRQAQDHPISPRNDSPSSSYAHDGGLGSSMGQVDGGLLSTSTVATSAASSVATSASDEPVRRRHPDRASPPAPVNPPSAQPSVADQAAPPQDSSSTQVDRRAEQVAPPQPLSLVIGAEAGRSWWYPHSQTEGSTSSGSLGSSYGVDYSIKPVDTVGGTLMGAVGNWAVTTTYQGSQSDIAQILAGGLGWFTGDSLWLSEAEWGRVQGQAVIKASNGTTASSDIDTTWRRAAIGWHEGIFTIGLEFERLALPSNYSLDDRDGQVVAVFDPTTTWTTGSLYVGVDNRPELMTTRQLGWHPLYGARIGVGLGELEFDHQAVVDIAHQASYEVECGSEVVRLLGEAQLGMAWQTKLGDAGIQVGSGGRLRANYYSNVATDPQKRSADHLTLVSSLSLVSLGIFAEVAVFW